MWKNLALLFVSMLLVSLLLEAAVRITYPANITVDRRETAYFREGIGMLKTPGQTARNIQACFEIPEIGFNSAGFRDNELPEQGPIDIGILADSSMEAMQVPEGEYTAALLETMLSKTVMNTGIGGASTVKELQIYRQIMSPRKPKVVLLFFTLGNDVLDNGCRTKQRAAEVLGEPEFTGACGTIVDGDVVYRAPWQPPQAAPAEASSNLVGPVGWLRSNCRSCRMINDVLKGTLGLTLSPTTQSEDDAYVAGWNLYRPLEALEPEAQVAWRESWSITEHALVDLRDRVAADGGRLIVVSPPDSMVVSRGWQMEFKIHHGYSPKHDFDPARPAKMLESLASRNEIPLLPLAPVFLAYRDRHGLSFPYFSFACDGHWNPLGHFLAASWLSETLVERGFIAHDDPGGFVLARQRERDRPPTSILGDEAYESIYRGKIFRNHSALQTYRPQ